MKHLRMVAGGRIIKTAMAVLITSAICELLDWPSMFAVITAIVTIEPTGEDSIKKAYVRFPASAIGAGFAVLFTFLFGDAPITYTLVATLTILACYKLKLHAGTIVATLTGVAMISTVHDQYVSSFFVRLGTTMTGLTVASVVNIFVMRPNYFPMIKQRLERYFHQVSEILEKRGSELVNREPLHRETERTFQRWVQEMGRLEDLCTYQKAEWKIHHFNRKEVRQFHYEYIKLQILRQIYYHVANLISLPMLEQPLDEKKAGLVRSMVEALASSMQSKDHQLTEQHEEVARKMVSAFHSIQMEQLPDQKDQSFHSFSPEMVIFYELLAIHDLLEELQEIERLETRHHGLYLG